MHKSNITDFVNTAMNLKINYRRHELDVMLMSFLIIAGRMDASGIIKLFTASKRFYDFDFLYIIIANISLTHFSPVSHFYTP